MCHKERSWQLSKRTITEVNASNAHLCMHRGGAQELWNSGSINRAIPVLGSLHLLPLQLTSALPLILQSSSNVPTVSLTMIASIGWMWGQDIHVISGLVNGTYFAYTSISSPLVQPWVICSQEVDWIWSCVHKGKLTNLTNYPTD